jgi:hypothetical protein
LIRAHALPVTVAGAVGWLLSNGPVSGFVDHHSRPLSILVVIAAGMAVIIPYYAILSITGMDRDERRQMLAWAFRGFRAGPPDASG